MRRSKSSGPLNICQVGFDVFSYMTRQNVFAPCIAEKVFYRPLINPNTGTKSASAPAVDKMGNAKLTQYRPKLKFEIKQGSESNNFLGAINGATVNGGYRNLVASSGKSGKDSSANDNITNIITYENYDDFNEMIDSENDLDAVLIATPDFWHAEHATVCLEAGLFILATSNLFRTTLFCSSVLLYIEP